MQWKNDSDNMIVCNCHFEFLRFAIFWPIGADPDHPNLLGDGVSDHRYRVRWFFVLAVADVNLSTILGGVFQFPGTHLWRLFRLVFVGRHVKRRNLWQPSVGSFGIDPDQQTLSSTKRCADLFAFHWRFG